MNATRPLLLLLLGVLAMCVSCTQSPDNLAQETAPSIPQGILYPTQPGSYTLGEWQYSYEIRLKGSRSETRTGSLSHRGVAVEGVYGDIKETPFGNLMYFGSGWNRGWLNTTTYDRRVFDKDGRPTKEIQDMLDGLKKQGKIK